MVDLKATPRPWFNITYGLLTPGETPHSAVSCSWPDPIDVAIMARGLTAQPEEAAANAALIVRAVNLHDELVEHVRLLERFMVYEIKRQERDNPADDEGIKLKSLNLNLIRATLAKVDAP